MNRLILASGAILAHLFSTGFSYFLLVTMRGRLPLLHCVLVSAFAVSDNWF
ncbi:MAG: hypothetical protein IPL65_01305 [Lewinellaceae bacterium]|nr:hypothetical protein [Lewinellaceae bacterium]